MPLASYSKPQFDQFFEAIAPLREAYGDSASFGYFALRIDGRDVLIRGVIWLNVGPPNIPFNAFVSKTVRAGHFLLSDLGLTLEQFVEKSLATQVPTPQGVLDFIPGDASNYHGARFVPFHQTGEQTQKQISVLTIFGDQTGNAIIQPDLDWELRSAETPYGNLNELLTEYQPGEITGVNSLDIAALPVVVLDKGSKVSGEAAIFVLAKATAATPEKISIGYRLIDHGKTMMRGQISSLDIEWSPEAGGGLAGRAEISVPKGSVVHAIAKYNGIAQHHYFLGDPAFHQNAKRGILEAFDTGLSSVNEILASTKGSRARSRDFEAVISWIFWMLGFSPAYLGNVITEGPDTIVASPNGNLAVVECTTGVLDVNKLAKLHARAQAVRAALQASNMQNLRAIPVIVTSLAKEDIRGSISSAEAQGIYVVAKEDIEALLQQTQFWPDANAIYDGFVRAVDSMLQRQIDPVLPNIEFPNT